MAQLNAYLMFDGNCREAMNFYKECLGGKLDIMTVGQTPQMAAEASEEMKNKVMHAYLSDGKFTLMASDNMRGTEYVIGNNVSLCLVCESKDEIESLFEKLSNGGKVGNPLNEEFFGTYGDLTDKFGMNWMFQYSADKK